MMLAKMIGFLLLIGVTSVANAASVALFQSNFSSASDNGSQIVDGAYSLTQGVGDASLGYHGLLDGTALVFNQLAGQDGESVELSVGGSFTNYHVEFDLYTTNLNDSGHAFRIEMGTSPQQALKFGGCCDNTAYLFSGVTTTLGSFADEQLMHVVIDIDLIGKFWLASVSGIGADTASLGNDQNNLESIKFWLSSASGSQSPDPLVTVGIDNLVVTATVPLPTTAWLFLSAIGGLIGFKRAARSR